MVKLCITQGCVIYLMLVCRVALHYASANTHYPCAMSLVAAGAGVNARDGRGCTPLHYAASSDADARYCNLYPKLL